MARHRPSMHSPRRGQVRVEAEAGAPHWSGPRPKEVRANEPHACMANGGMAKRMGWRGSGG